MGEFVSQLEKLWPLVMQAPWAFVTLAIALMLAGWAAGRFIYRERLATFQSRVEARDEIIAKLREDAASVSDNGISAKHYLIGQLTAQYIGKHPDASKRLKMGLEKPPTEWINAELKELGEDWRVKIGRTGEYEIYDVARWGWLSPVGISFFHLARPLASQL
jgi:hypothetical protein